MTRCLECYKKKCDIETCTHVCHKWDHAVAKADANPVEERKREEESSREFLGL